MKKHSVTIAGHRTSISLEDEFWTGLKSLAASRNKSLADIIRQIDRDRGANNLSSAIRISVLDHYKAQIPDNTDLTEPTNPTE
ncbi:ribbon-helix-helix domain-containing protein [Cohaesibacter celericrescens]|uniref:Aryl-sulfate sulfotransferase n=1 Tax=Cohaesibacter celericrescens TaxID=2067669 RepID=A0A2N5XWV3_9HYPH|nr:ribbon-helix-helix domain-containing protein [Cohaesibacter celericrescens]PLW75530.1 aryl-sulfate sulfotransferase [Cohaesibacter celericrescens]PLW78937.1 aryl-sulfate sulfotransferase [Cohaesibacter celericrescens]